MVGGPEAVVRAGPPQFQRREHVGAQMLHGLERSDRTVELHPLVAVRHRHVEQRARGADAVDDVPDHPPVGGAPQVGGLELAAA